MKRTGGGHDDGARERRRGGWRGGKQGRVGEWRGQKDGGSQREGRMEGKGREDETHFLLSPLISREGEMTHGLKNWSKSDKRSKR